MFLRALYGGCLADDTNISASVCANLFHGSGADRLLCVGPAGIFRSDVPVWSADGLPADVCFPWESGTFSIPCCFAEDYFIDSADLYIAAVYGKQSGRGFSGRADCRFSGGGIDGNSVFPDGRQKNAVE